MAEKQEDANVVFDILENRHPNAFYTQPREEYNKKKNALIAKLPSLSKNDFYYELKKFISSIEDAHTQFSQSEKANSDSLVIPINIARFSDKWCPVYPIPKQYEPYLGKEITAINQTPMAEVFKLIDTMNASENKAGADYRFKNSWMFVETLKFLGIISNENDITLTFSGNEKIKIEPAALSSYKTVEFSRVKAPPPTAADFEKNYFSKELDADTFYVQYNSCVESEPNLADFGAEIEKAVSSHKYKTAILDLRNNGGGNTNLLGFFSAPLLSIMKSNGGRLYCIIGNATFSAAFSNAISLQDQGAILVGQPTGGNMQQFTEVTPFELPNSRFIGQFSTEWADYREGAPYDSLYPDIMVEHTVDAMKNGIDEEISAIYKDVKNKAK